jgi:hypothetical protein
MEIVAQGPMIGPVRIEPMSLLEKLSLVAKEREGSVDIGWHSVGSR